MSVKAAVQIMLTVGLDSERSGLGSGTGLVTKKQSEACAGGFDDIPCERCASQITPGEERRRSRATTGDNALHRKEEDGLIG